MRTSRNLAKILFIVLLVSSFTVSIVNAVTGDWWLMLDRGSSIQATDIYLFNNTIGNKTVTYLGTTPDTSNEHLFSFQSRPYVIIQSGERNGTIYYLANREGVNGIWLYNSTNYGQTWNAMFQAKSGNQLGSSIGFSQSTQTLHFAYGRDFDVYYAGNYSLVSGVHTADAKLIIDGTTPFNSYTFVVDDTDNLFFLSVAGYSGGADRFIYKQRVSGSWSGYYTYNNNDLTQVLAQYDTVHDRLITTVFDTVQDCTYANYKNLTSGAGTGWGSWNRVSDTAMDNSYDYMGYDTTCELLKVMNADTYAGRIAPAFSYSSYPFNSYTTYNSCNNSLADFRENIFFDRHYWETDKIAINTANPSPDRVYTMNEGFVQSGHTWEYWLINSKNFDLQDDDSEIWTVYDNAYLVGVPYPEIHNVTITNIDGTYLFTNKRYTLKAETENCNFVRLNFTDGLNYIEFEWNRTYNQFNILCDNTQVISLTDFNNYTKNNLDVLEWEFMLLDNIIDSHCIMGGYGVLPWLSQSYNHSYSNLYEFDIFNLGGSTTYVTSGNGEHIKGANPESVRAWGSGSYASAITTFGKVQHVHLTVELDNGAPYNTGTNAFVNMTGGFYEFRVNYFINGTMLNGWKVRLYPNSASVGGYGATSDYDWVDWTIEHYVYNRTTSLYDLKQTGNLISNYDGYDHDDSAHGYTSKTTVKWFIDMWFSNENRSSVVATRINPEYFGLYEQGNPFWFGWGAFRPLWGNETVSMFYDNVYDNNSDIVPIRGRVELVQFVVHVEKVTGNEVYEIRNFVMKNIQEASYYMEGVDVPAFVATKVISMPRTGFLTPLVKAISNIGNLIWSACMGFIYVLIGAIDGLLVLFGLPEGMFSSMLNWVSIQAGTIWGWISIVTSYAVDMLYVFVNLVNLILAFMGYIIQAITWVVVWVIPLPLHIFLFLYAVVTSGTWTYMGYTWNFTAWSSITDALWAVAPYFIVWSFMIWLFLGDTDDDIGGLPNRLLYVFSFMKEGYQSLFWIFNHMRNEIISLYNFARSHIPFLSSGGGETEE